MMTTSLHAMGSDPQLNCYQTHDANSISNVLSQCETGGECAPVDSDHLEIYNRFKRQTSITNSLTRAFTTQHHALDHDLATTRASLVLMNNLPNDFFYKTDDDDDDYFGDDNNPLQLDIASALGMSQTSDDADLHPLTPVESILSSQHDLATESLDFANEHPSLKLYMFGKLKGLLFKAPHLHHHRHFHRPHHHQQQQQQASSTPSTDVDPSPVCLQIPVFSASGDIDEPADDDHLESDYSDDDPFPSLNQPSLNSKTHYKKLDLSLFKVSNKPISSTVTTPKIKFSEMAEMVMYVNSSKINGSHEKAVPAASSRTKSVSSSSSSSDKNVSTDSPTSSNFSSNSARQGTTISSTPPSDVNPNNSPTTIHRSNSLSRKISTSLRRSLSKKNLKTPTPGKNSSYAYQGPRPILKNRTNQNFNDEWSNTLQLDRVELDKFLMDFENEETMKFEQEPQLTRIRLNQLKNYYESEGFSY